MITARARPRGHRDARSSSRSEVSRSRGGARRCAGSSFINLRGVCAVEDCRLREIAHQRGRRGLRRGLSKSSEREGQGEEPNDESTHPARRVLLREARLLRGTQKGEKRVSANDR